MHRNLPTPKSRESAAQVLDNPNWKGNKLFGLPWRIAISLVSGSGFLLGALIFGMVALGWCPTATRGEPGQEHFVLTLRGFGFFVVLIGTTMIAAIALLGNFEETWHRLGILAVAGGFMISGVWTIVIHRIEIHPDRFVIRGPLNPIHEYLDGANPKAH